MRKPKQLRLRRELHELVEQVTEYVEPGITFPLAPGQQGYIVPEEVLTRLQALAERYPPPGVTRHCRQCGAALGQKNRSGLCSSCYRRAYYDAHIDRYRAAQLAYYHRQKEKKHHAKESESAPPA